MATKTPPKKEQFSTPKKGGRGAEADLSWHPSFIAALKNSGNVRAACHAAKVDRKTSYNHKAAFPDFEEQWETAMEDAVDSLEAVAVTRARSSSDTLLIFLLKAHRPEKYRERLDVSMSNKTEAELLAIIGAGRVGGAGAAGTGE